MTLAGNLYRLRAEDDFNVSLWTPHLKVTPIKEFETLNLETHKLEARIADDVARLLEAE